MGAAIRKRRRDVPKGLIYEGIPATRSGPYFSFGGNAKIMARSSHVAVTDIRQLKIAEANTYWGTNDDFEQTPAGSNTVTASVEYPSGQFSQILFAGGSPSVVVAPLTYVESNYVTPCQMIPRGATFWIRRYLQNSTGTCAGFARNRDSGAGDLCNLNASTDQTMGGTISNTGANWSPPFGIFGPTDQPSIVVPGDSICHGNLDETGNTITDFRRGFICHGFNADTAFLNHGNSAIQASNFQAGSTCRRQAWKYASHVINGLGRNDLAASHSSATLTSDLQKLIFPQFRPGIPIFQATLICTTSSGGSLWETDGDQGHSGWEAARVTFNTGARATIAGTRGFFETCNAVENGQDSGFWLGDGVTPQLNTNDGIHPNAHGYPLCGSAVNAVLAAKIHM